MIIIYSVVGGVTSIYYPVCPSVGRFVGRSVGFSMLLSEQLFSYTLEILHDAIDQGCRTKIGQGGGRNIFPPP